MTASLRILSLRCALALAIATPLAAAGTLPALAATHPPVLATDTGAPTDLVNRPGCGNGGDDETRPACEAGRW